MKTGNFRKNFFGGFNRDDVTKYIVKLAEERNEYKERAEKAEEELASRDEAAVAAEDVPAEAVSEEVPEELSGETEDTDAPSEEETVPEEPEKLDIEQALMEIRESVAAVNAGIQESVAAIRGELERAEETGEAPAEDQTAAPEEPKVPVAPPEVSDNISRVLGMLECTEAHFTLLEKTLKAIKNDVADV